MGKNAYGSWIVGSFLEEDEDDLTVLYYIHFLLKNSDYLAFVSGRISYRDIFILSRDAYVLKRDLATLDVQAVFFVKAYDITEDYWPHEKSNYPAKRKSSSLIYTVSVQGGTANSHVVLSKNSLEIQRAVSELLEYSLTNLPNLGITADVFQSVPTEGSFRFAFEVDVDVAKAKDKDFFFRKELFGAYQNDLIEYTLKYLPAEVAQLYSTEEAPEYFAELVESAKSLYQKLGKQIEDEKLLVAVKEGVQITANSLVEAASSVGDAYDSIEFLGMSQDGNSSELIGAVTTQSKADLEGAVLLIDTLTQVDEEIVTDDSARQYKVYIYSLNAETRKGTGILIHEDGTVFKPKLSISGVFPLEETKFTESIYTHKIINVSAVGTYKKGKLIRLVIEE